jgi:hypothetical protein
MVKLLPTRLLGRHIQWCALPTPLPPPPHGVSTGQTKINDLQLSRLGEQNVLRLQIAMHQVEGTPVLIVSKIGLIEAVRELTPELGYHLDWNRPVSLDAGIADIAQGQAVDVFHHYRARIFDELIDPAYAAVLDLLQKLELMPQGLPSAAIRGVAQDLDRDPARTAARSRNRSDGTINRTKCAATQLRMDLICTDAFQAQTP